jgi:hypothetical protein
MDLGILLALRFNKNGNQNKEAFTKTEKKTTESHRVVHFASG